MTPRVLLSSFPRAEPEASNDTGPLEAWDHFFRSGQLTPYTAICNVIGCPAVSLPLYQGDDGLPLAVQLSLPLYQGDDGLPLAVQLSLPLYQGDDGLPLAVQLIGRSAGKDALLALAAQVEAALP